MVILFVRCSTFQQDLESQKNDLISFSKSLNYTDFEVIGSVGASAVKVNELYLQSLEQLKERCLKGDVEAVLVWHLNRLARNELIAMQMKQFFIENKIQLIVKEPFIKLLNDDGSVNSGAELMFTLFATINKQNAEEIKQKSMRGKKFARENKRYIGGKVPIGYKVGENKSVIIDEPNAEVVRLVFQLYSSGNYSFRTLYEEITERGYVFARATVEQMLSEECYVNGKYYIPLISNELFDKCTEVRKRNFNTMKRENKHYSFCNRLIRCTKCGGGYTLHKNKYTCYNYFFENKIKHSPSISQKYMDSLLWAMVKKFESKSMQEQTKTDIVKIQEEIAVREQKIVELGNSAKKIQTMRERLLNAFLNILITEEEYSKRLQNINEQEKELDAKRIRWEEEITNYKNMLNGNTKKEEFERWFAIDKMINYSTFQQMNNLVRKWIKKITIDDDYLVTIDTLVGVWKIYYKPTKKSCKWWWENVPIYVQTLDLNGGGFIGNTFEFKNFQKWFNKMPF